VSIAINSLKNIRVPGSDGQPAQLFKYAGPDFVRSMHQIIAKIWIEEKMRDEWSDCVITPVCKKGDKMECSTYYGLRLNI
jgi:hypothetical protein